jgi:hypothetical protein
VPGAAPPAGGAEAPRSTVKRVRKASADGVPAPAQSPAEGKGE